MNDWDATNYAAKDNLLRVLRREADALFEMAGERALDQQAPPVRNGRPGTSSVT